MNKIDINKQYRTREGAEVKLFTTEARSEDYPVVGEYYDEVLKEWCHETWTAEGRAWCYEDDDHPRDLIEVTGYDHLKKGDIVLVSDHGFDWACRRFAGVHESGDPMAYVRHSSYPLRWRHCLTPEEYAEKYL